VLFREGLVSLLDSQDDFEVVGEAGCVQEAIELARKVDPELILMDFSLPDGTGLDATVSILAEKPEIKIVFLTVHENDERLFAAIRTGAKGYLLKNQSVKNLLASLRALNKGEAAISRTMMTRIMEEFQRGEHPQDDPPPGLSELTTREVEILRELATNASNREISARLFISENTVKNHVHNILEKLKLSNRREAVEYARHVGLASNGDSSRQ
jgi:DNA-binding NarL/FixJ family response regulator